MIKQKMPNQDRLLETCQKDLKPDRGQMGEELNFVAVPNVF